MQDSILVNKTHHESPNPGWCQSKQAHGAGEATAPVAGLVQQLHRFLKQNVDVLDPHVTATLLLSYGRMEDLMQYAFFRQVRPRSVL